MAFGSLAPGMPKPKVPKPRKPKKWKAPGMAAYAGVTQQPMPRTDLVPSAQGGVDDEGGAEGVG